MQTRYMYRGRHRRERQRSRWQAVALYAAGPTGAAFLALMTFLGMGGETTPVVYEARPPKDAPTSKPSLPVRNLDDDEKGAHSIRTPGGPVPAARQEPMIVERIPAPPPTPAAAPAPPPPPALAPVDPPKIAATPITPPPTEKAGPDATSEQEPPKQETSKPKTDEPDPPTSPPSTPPTTAPEEPECDEGYEWSPAAEKCVRVAPEPPDDDPSPSTPSDDGGGSDEGGSGGGSDSGGDDEGDED